MNTLTRDQIEARKARAVHFVRDFLGDPVWADDIQEEGLEDYAARRNFEMVIQQTGEELWQQKSEIRRTD